MSDGVLFKGNMEEGSYRLIKTTDGWVLVGKDIVFAGSDITDRPQGEWIRIEWNENIEGHIVPMRIYKCSTCGEKEVALTRFCPNCGADMRKESE